MGPQRPQLRFVEVKLRDPDDPLADEALTPGKRTRLRACARAWLEAHPQVAGAELAFLVAVVPPERGESAAAWGGRGARPPPATPSPGEREIAWLDDAFDG
jgi:Holliday junction resolvase-like predicted endonuclease